MLVYICLLLVDMVICKELKSLLVGLVTGLLAWLLPKGYVSSLPCLGFFFQHELILNNFLSVRSLMGSN